MIPITKTTIGTTIATIIPGDWDLLGVVTGLVGLTGLTIISCPHWTEIIPFVFWRYKALCDVKRRTEFPSSETKSPWSLVKRGSKKKIRNSSYQIQNRLFKPEIETW